MPENLSSRNVVDVVKEAVAADRRRNKQMFTRLEASGERQAIYGSVSGELERRLREQLVQGPVPESFFGEFMYSGLLSSTRRIIELEEENARLREELADKEHV